MLTIGLLVAIASAQPSEPVCELSYARQPGSFETALRVTTDGTATIVLRGEVRETKLGRETVAKLEQRLERYQVFERAQSQFDEALNTAAREAGLKLPIPYADVCQIQIGIGSLRCRGSSILATRLPHIVQLKEFERLRGDLEQIRSIVVLGGPTEFAEFLMVGRSAIGMSLPLSTMVYADDFDGERVAHFRPSGIDGPLLIVSSRDGEYPTARVIEIDTK